MSNSATHISGIMDDREAKYLSSAKVAYTVHGNTTPAPLGISVVTVGLGFPRAWLG